MKLLFSPNRNYIHKVLVVAIESGVLDRIVPEPQYPLAPGSNMLSRTPLGKVPAMELDNGDMLYGGIVICEYLDSLTKGKRLFPQDGTRWEALRQMMLGDGLFDAIVELAVGTIGPRENWRMDHLLRDRKRIFNCFRQMEEDIKGYQPENFHIGHVCFAGGLSVYESRGAEHLPPNTKSRLVQTNLVEGDADFEWRKSYPRLAAWYDEILKRPSMDSVAAHDKIGAVPMTRADYQAAGGKH